ncbi:division/cell wall cluster transcriptional repressor MraZ [Rhodothermus profundi]|uniref:Transcriptional regulator MraZ n=1 Tax=Rhodothermus profundi TaxID=633813 RepID=A0A1M6REX9_9BACT|nr:division/cell wall cluster transcriptional repressor MraZ [Rhodothermus profundi]SHK31035.1 MraZ protein [Rhodothermus profundi]
MASFKGQAAYSVDEKGRVAIPAKMRAVLKPEAKGTFTATRGFERCIFLYPLDRWEEIEMQMMKLNLYQREARNFVRQILRWAEEVTLDKQGRVVLPKVLMEFAGITDRALIIGALDHIEIWNPATFEQFVNEQPLDYETLAEKVMGV